MTPHEIALVRDGFARVAPIADTVAVLFYGRLFETHPHLRAMFRAPVPEQGRKLIAALGTVVASLDRLERVLPAIEALAVRHVAYGVRPEHYAAVGAALIWTLRVGLGGNLAPEAEAAWATAYGLVSDAMIAAAWPAAAA